jgi:predicted alpha/beta-hydrolase family hydrolase
MHVKTPAGDVTIAFDPCPTDAGAPVFVCAHGAGGSYADRGVVGTTAVLREHGLTTVRFNFPYREKKSGRPDPMPVLKACIESVVAHVRSELAPGRLIIGGRSMGGRAASMLAADGFTADGLLLLAYPLHPPRQPAKLRDAHLPSIAMPTLCINGTRDEFCTRTLMDDVMTRVQSSFRMHWIEGADHSFHVLKSSGRTDADVMADIGSVARDWVASTSSVSP